MKIIPHIEFCSPVWHWRGPSPFYFVTVPQKESTEIKKISKMVTYGWGMIPVVAKMCETEWKTSLYEKEGRYILPIKKAVRDKENLAEGDSPTVILSIG